MLYPNADAAMVGAAARAGHPAAAANIGEGVSALQRLNEDALALLDRIKNLSGALGTTANIAFGAEPEPAPAPMTSRPQRFAGSVGALEQLLAEAHQALGWAEENFQRLSRIA